MVLWLIFYCIMFSAPFIALFFLCKTSDAADKKETAGRKDMEEFLERQQTITLALAQYTAILIFIGISTGFNVLTIIYIIKNI